MAALTSRERKILFSLVAEYIASGVPVGSRTLSRKYGLELSAATIRNVLADLEHDGMLAQPHTSAGRIPTALALRTFIEALSELQPLPERDHLSLRDRIEEIYGPAAGSRRDCMQRTGQYLSELSGAAAIVAASPAETRQLSQLRFIPTRPDQLLAVLVFTDGTVQNRYLRIAEPLGERELNRVHDLLGDVVDGLTLRALRETFARELESERERLDALRTRAFELAGRAIRSRHRRVEDVVITGQSRLMDLPDYTDVGRVKGVVRALEEREHLVDLIDRTIEAGTVSVYIGGETEELGEAELSLVAAPYGDAVQGAGTVGVLGPTRMDYARVVPLVEATAAAISDALKKER